MIKVMFTDMFLFQFQTKDSDMHAYVDSWHPHDGDRNQQNNKLSSVFFIIQLLYWLKMKQPNLKLASFIKWSLKNLN